MNEERRRKQLIGEIKMARLTKEIQSIIMHADDTDKEFILKLPFKTIYIHATIHDETSSIGVLFGVISEDDALEYLMDWFFDGFEILDLNEFDTLISPLLV
ncbi:MAG: hypothetical protein IIX48_05120 [Lachnospiraceae bacterium]|nr:hypothetical protein [Lachnospiraceae bacterium]